MYMKNSPKYSAFSEKSHLICHNLDFFTMLQKDPTLHELMSCKVNHR